MTSTILERTRALHEEIERLQTEAVNLMKVPPKTQKETVTQERSKDCRGHVVLNALKRICSAAKQLSDVYDDTDGSRREEIVTIGGQGPSLYNTFYTSLRDIKEYHRRFPDSTIDEYVGLPESEYNPDVQFTGEESFGRYLDLHEHHNAWCNLGDGFKKLDYIHYLSSHHQLGKERKNAPPFRLALDTKQDERNKKYIKYLEDLSSYLVSYFCLAQPLFDIHGKLASLEREFEQKWNTNEYKLSQVVEESVENPLYCKACQKLFSKDTTYRNHLSGKRHQQSTLAMEKKQEANKQKQSDFAQEYRQVCRLEFMISSFAEVLSEVYQRTQENVNKKFGRTVREIEEEAWEAEEEDDFELVSDDEPEEEIKQTIDNYPVGWDGKPIPYWLYKLHGLGVEFKCEICGNTSYWGRRAFERHFQEWRHAHGMACLGIPNTLHFHEITKIADAQALWIKIQRDRSLEEWRPDAEEECEDGEGNVYSRKLYIDLIRQGVIAGNAN